MRGQVAHRIERAWAGVRLHLPRTLAWLLVPLVAVGWGLAQLLPLRIEHISDFTAALFHQGVASVFALILGASALVNAAIVTSRTSSNPRPRRFRAYLVWQSIVLLLGLVWIVCIAIGDAAFLFEMVVGTGIALASIGAFVAALMMRREMVRSAQGEPDREWPSEPERRRQRRVRRIAIPVAAVAAVALVVSQFVPGTRQDCELQGYATGFGGGSMLTSCGEFSIGPEVAIRDLENSVRVDIDTRGWSLALGFPVLLPSVRLTAVRVVPLERWSMDD